MNIKLILIYNLNRLVDEEKSEEEEDLTAGEVKEAVK